MAKFYSASTKGFYDNTFHQTMPGDAVAVTDEAYAALFEAQAAGKIIQPDSNGNPEAVMPPALTGNALIQQQINALEATQTKRRIREAAAGADGGWLANLNTQIAALRAQLT